MEEVRLPGGSNSKYRSHFALLKHLVLGEVQHRLESPERLYDEKMKC